MFVGTERIRRRVLMTSGTVDWLRGRLVLPGVGIALGRRAVVTTLLAVVCATSFAPRLAAARAVDTADRPCAGDCDGNGTVTVEEVVSAVKILLGMVPPDRCPNLRCDGQDRVTVECLVKAVHAALH